MKRITSFTLVCIIFITTVLGLIPTNTVYAGEGDNLQMTAVFSATEKYDFTLAYVDVNNRGPFQWAENTFAFKDTDLLCWYPVESWAGHNGLHDTDYVAVLRNDEDIYFTYLVLNKATKGEVLTSGHISKGDKLYYKKIESEADANVVRMICRPRSSMLYSNLNPVYDYYGNLVYGDNALYEITHADGDVSDLFVGLHQDKYGAGAGKYDTILYENIAEALNNFSVDSNNVGKSAAILDLLLSFYGKAETKGNIVSAIKSGISVASDKSIFVLKSGDSTDDVNLKYVERATAGQVIEGADAGSILYDFVTNANSTLDLKLFSNSIRKAISLESDSESQDWQKLKYHITNVARRYETCTVPGYSDITYKREAGAKYTNAFAVLCIGEWSREARDEFNQQRNEELDAEALEKFKASVMANMTLYEVWHAAILNYAMGNGKVYYFNEAPSIKFNLDDLAAYIKGNKSKMKPADTPENWDLTEEEVLRLRTYATIACRKGFYLSDDVRHDISAAVLPGIDLFYENDQFEFERFSYGSSTARMLQYANEIAIAYANRGEYSGNFAAETIAKNLDGLYAYLAAQVYGFEVENPLEYKEPTDGFIVDDQTLPYNAFLQSILNTYADITSSTDVLASVSTDIPKLGNISMVAGNEEAYRAYVAIQYMYLMMEFYSPSLLPGDYEEKGGSDQHSNRFYNESIDRMLVEVGKANIDEDEKERLLRNLRNTAAEFLAIARAFDLVGIKPEKGSRLYDICYYYYPKLLSYEDYFKSVSNDYTNRDSEPLNAIMSVQDRDFSASYKKGISLSATYIPLRTNVYDLDSLAPLDDLAWVETFHYGYGFYRKALYIDTNINSAVDKYITGASSANHKVCTLRDLMQPEKDISLYVDESFYNVGELAETLDMIYEKVNNSAMSDEYMKTEDVDFWDHIVNWVSEFADVDIESTVKTGDKHIYSETIRKVMSNTYNNEDGKGYESKFNLLSTAKIQEYLNVNSRATTTYHNEYSPMQSFAVVSAIYKSSQLYSAISSYVHNPEPVFVSSPRLFNVQGITRKEWNTIYNYIMVCNLEEAAGVDYEVQLDMDSPLYMDIYGNILTESGLVVIPAASNATLFNADDYSIATAGFMYLYGFDQYSITDKILNAKKFLLDQPSSVNFQVDTVTNAYIPKRQRMNVNGSYLEINPMNFPYASLESKRFLLTFFDNYLNDDIVPFNQRVYIITEVLRGAPLDEINKQVEGLSGTIVTNTNSIYVAMLFEDLIEQLLPSTQGNQIISLPNLAFMDNVEYVLLFGYKIAFAVLMLLFVYRVYTDAVKSRVSIRAAISFLLSIALFIVTIFAIPTLMDVSYYQVNKKLLQPEASYVLMLNMQKEQSGREVGMTEVTSPETKTQLYLKINDIDIPWYEMLGDVIFKNSYKTVSDAYHEKISKTYLAGIPGVIEKGNGLYMDVNDVMDATTMYYDKSDQTIYNVVNDTLYASYVTPYYAILDHMVASVNSYNQYNDIEEYTVVVGNSGAVDTRGAITTYFTSNEFMKFLSDPTGLRNIYQMNVRYKPSYMQDVFTTGEAEDGSDNDFLRMSRSYWYMEALDYDEMDARITKIENSTRKFIADNREVLGKVSDGVFLKVLAMYIATTHNSVMGIDQANALEIYDVDARDIIRLSIASKSDVMMDSSKSFSRFVFDRDSLLGTILVALLIGFYWLASFIKPICLIIVLAFTILSVVLRRLVSREKNRVLEGYLISLTVLCGLNALYALVFKGSILLANLNLTTTTSISLQLLIQTVYMVLLVLFTVFVVRNWKDYGYARYQIFAERAANKMSVDKMSTNVNNARVKLGSNAKLEGNVERDREYMRRPNGRRHFNTVGKTSRRNMSGRAIYDSLHSRDERRRRGNARSTRKRHH